VKKRLRETSAKDVGPSMMISELQLDGCSEQTSFILMKKRSRTNQTDQVRHTEGNREKSAHKYEE
jgi:hypothetical protein